MSVLKTKVVDDLLHERSLCEVDTVTNVMNVDADETGGSALVLGVESLHEGFPEFVSGNRARRVCRKKEVVDMELKKHDLSAFAIVGGNIFEPHGVVVVDNLGPHDADEEAAYRF